MSVYKDDSEEAWVTFPKNPGVDDVWFHPGRVVDSHPWDKTQLQESTAQHITNTGGRYYWLISEGTKYNTNAVGDSTAHAHWLPMVTGYSCDLMNPETQLPVILYIKQVGPTYLANHGRLFQCVFELDPYILAKKSGK